MKKVLIAAVMVVVAVCAGASVSWGQTVTTDSATWESDPTLDITTVWQ